jgi:hypothetical protein
MTSVTEKRNLELRCRWLPRGRSYYQQKCNLEATPLAGNNNQSNTSNALTAETKARASSTSLISTILTH